MKRKPVRLYIASIISLPVIYWAWKVAIAVAYGIMQQAIPDIAIMGKDLDPFLSWPVLIYSTALSLVALCFIFYLIETSFPD